MYILKIKQYEKIYDVGIFETEESIFKFIESIPFVKKEILENDYVDYFMKFKDLPDYYEIKYNNYVYIISRFSFIPDDGEIYFDWNKIHLWDEKIAIKETFIEGETTVDAYNFLNNEVRDYIEKREELYRETEKYYKKRGVNITRNALGSEDGEYIESSNGTILYLLDPSTVDIWKQSKCIDEFIEKYIEL
ncbi:MULTISPECIES: hypothetical protein [Clostridium]|uniref:hypothetical protein n=1 Tax=Clostridium TaxID=1485 RepID=UPI0002CAD122|nr:MULTISPECIES: hypothetical protein [Clostridium]EMU52396.1 hypothetical protein CBDKU1_38280 [Clostridium butyricum DKU-01]KJZ88772.1 hypothetical protein ClosIBUN125C_CONTIG19g01266 [Clostridium sp. IBUN125C]KJZ96258.1 hypothetical protein ClosIBUN13A_CONTIG165g02524 [Clostridium sp. IBUN13A]